MSENIQEEKDVFRLQKKRDYPLKKGAERNRSRFIQPFRADPAAVSGSGIAPVQHLSVVRGISAPYFRRCLPLSW